MRCVQRAWIMGIRRQGCDATATWPSPFDYRLAKLTIGRSEDTEAYVLESFRLSPRDLPTSELAKSPMLQWRCAYQ
jgi:hypothetical protein